MGDFILLRVAAESPYGRVEFEQKTCRKRVSTSCCYEGRGRERTFWGKETANTKALK